MFGQNVSWSRSTRGLFVALIWLWLASDDSDSVVSIGMFTVVLVSILFGGRPVSAWAALF